MVLSSLVGVEPLSGAQKIRREADREGRPEWEPQDTGGPS